MPKYSLLLLLVLFIACIKNEEEAINKSEKIDHDIELEKLRYLKEVEWPMAYREQDTALLDRILGDEFQMITNGGEWSDKKKQLNRIKSGPMDHDSFRYEIKRLEILENETAIIAGTGHIQNDSIKTIYQSSNILIRREGNWKAVLSHVSGVKDLN